jgi:bacterioferritin-associated ferredoxin
MIRIIAHTTPACCDSLCIEPRNWNPLMIVCICNNISDREIRQAVDLGLRSMAELRQELGVGTCCGQCVSCARATMHAHLDSQAVALELRRPAPGKLVAPSATQMPGSQCALSGP